MTERHIRRLVQERRIPFIKRGHPLRFDPDEIDAWVDTKRVPCQSRASWLTRAR
ncbi:MAG: helix-turn-helix domain-containing protein [Actinomycetota bacterium]|nr:helix-turn-helix domain-containing protein [Actinomycetota bacterium]